MTTRAAARRSSPLLLRIESAVVLIPAALAAVWFGSPWLDILVAAAGVAMGWEWGRLGSARRFSATAIVAMIPPALAVLAAASAQYGPALLVAAVGALALAVMQPRDRVLVGAGSAWIVAGCIAFLWLDLPQNGGRAAVIWLLLVVWATDILAYLVGTTLRGPRLAPRLSPNKTWAGFIGGCLGAVLVGVLTAIWTGMPAGRFMAVSLLWSLAAQGGDLAESWAKRRFAVKDSSGLIPGHGGVLDRLDGLLAAAMVAALLTLVVKGAVLHLG